HSAYYKNNAQKYLKKIAKIQKIANNIKAVKKPVLVSEPVFDYALIAAGYKIGNPEFEEAVEKETDPSPKIIKHMNKMIATIKIAFFVNNTQVNS
nr:ABC transporter substrate-binding protein [Streptococcus anginosus]